MKVTTLQKSLAAAAAMLLLTTATAALGQTGPTDFSRGQRPCGDYYGSEYGTYCTPGIDGSITRNTCAYRTGPPCPPSGPPPKRRR
jgi:hypothetical protein